MRTASGRDRTKLRISQKRNCESTAKQIWVDWESSLVGMAYKYENFESGLKLRLFFLTKGVPYYMFQLFTASTMYCDLWSCVMLHTLGTSVKLEKAFVQQFISVVKAFHDRFAQTILRCEISNYETTPSLISFHTLLQSRREQGSEKRCQVNLFQVQTAVTDSLTISKQVCYDRQYSETSPFSLSQKQLLPLRRNTKAVCAFF